MGLARRPVVLAACLLVAFAMVGCGSQEKAAIERPRPSKTRSSKAATAAAPAAKPPEASKAKAPVAPKAVRKMTPGELLRQLQRTYRGMSSLRINGYSETVVLADGKPVSKPSRQDALLVFRRPNRLLVRTKASEVTVDGKNVYTYNPAAKRYMKDPLTPAFLKNIAGGKPGVGVMGLLLGTDYTKAVVSAKMLLDTKIGGRDVYVLSFQLKPREDALKGITGSQTLWIGKSDMGIYKNALTIKLDTTKVPTPTPHKTGEKAARIIETIVTSEQASFEPNVKVTDADFAFRPPAGAKLVKQSPPVNLLNKPAPDFPYTAADGTSTKLSDLRGKLVVIDFWALPMCEQHLPVMQSLSKSLTADTEFLPINLNPDREAVKEHLRKKKYTFPLVFGDQQMAKVVGEQYGLRALPTVLILDKDGIVRAQFLGEASRKQIDERLNVLRSKGQSASP